MIIKISAGNKGMKIMTGEQKESILFAKGQFTRLLEKKLKMPVSAYRL